MSRLVKKVGRSDQECSKPNDCKSKWIRESFTDVDVDVFFNEWIKIDCLKNEKKNLLSEYFVHVYILLTQNIKVEKKVFHVCNAKN